jgi:hypothetical protein
MVVLLHFHCWGCYAKDSEGIDDTVPGIEREATFPVLPCVGEKVRIF